MAVWLCKWLLIMLHPLYVSVTDIQYNEQDKVIELSVRIFTDDMEATIKQQHPQQKVDLTHPANPKQADAWLNGYIQQHLQLNSNGKLLAIKYVGYEVIGESVWVYFETAVMPLPTQLQIKNTLLYDFKKEQINIVHTKIGGAERTTKLTYPTAEASFSFH
ncbi:MAG: DUF6702 family protein [Chitinophagaceae bacterium]